MCKGYKEAVRVAGMQDSHPTDYRWENTHDYLKIILLIISIFWLHYHYPSSRAGNICLVDNWHSRITLCTKSSCYTGNYFLSWPRLVYPACTMTAFVPTHSGILTSGCGAIWVPAYHHSRTGLGRSCTTGKFNLPLRWRGTLEKVQFGLRLGNCARGWVLGYDVERSDH
jgi:hypothetical protein